MASLRVRSRSLVLISTIVFSGPGCASKRSSVHTCSTSLIDGRDKKTISARKAISDTLLAITPKEDSAHTLRISRSVARTSQPDFVDRFLHIPAPIAPRPINPKRSEEHTSELQSLMRNSYAVFCLKKKKKHNTS